jgi:hypothetical protein
MLSNFALLRHMASPILRAGQSIIISNKFLERSTLPAPDWFWETLTFIENNLNYY